MSPTSLASVSRYHDGLVGTLAYEFQVTLPVVAKQTFHGGPSTYGFPHRPMGCGRGPRWPRHSRPGPHGTQGC